MIRLIVVTIIALNVNSCSVKDDDIVGRWYYESDYAIIDIRFNSDKSGEMQIQADEGQGSASLTCTQFTWETDGYLVTISGTATRGYISQFSDEVRTSGPTSVHAKFRYSDGKLTSEGLLPGIPLAFSSNNFTLFKK